MNKSDTIGKLSKALTAVQSQIRPALKDSDNPFFKSKYADLNSVWETARELLAKNGLAVIQGNTVGEMGTIIVETVLSHESGEWIQSSLSLPLAKHDPQGVGSAITYGRRYGLSAIVGIVADVDDDANAASGNGQPSQRREPIKLSEPPKASDKLRTRITSLCKDLNSSGDSIKWQPSVLFDYVKEQWNVGYENMNDSQLAAVATDLSKRLSDLTKAEVK